MSSAVVWNLVCGLMSPSDLTEESLSRKNADVSVRCHRTWKCFCGRDSKAPSPQTQPSREREAPVKPSTGSRAPGSAPPPRRGGAASGNSVGSGGAPPRVPNRESPSRLGNGAAHSALEAEYEQLKEDHEKVREEIVDLKITVDGLETERDFYFQKLRDIEILCQADLMSVVCLEDVQLDSLHLEHK